MSAESRFELFGEEDDEAARWKRVFWEKLTILHKKQDRWSTIGLFVLFVTLVAAAANAVNLLKGDSFGPGNVYAIFLFVAFGCSLVWIACWFSLQRRIQETADAFIHGGPNQTEESVQGPEE